MQGWARQRTKTEDLTEAKEIKNRWQEYTEKKKSLNDLDNYLEPDILECEVKWPWEALL